MLLLLPTAWFCIAYEAEVVARGVSKRSQLLKVFLWELDFLRRGGKKFPPPMNRGEGGGLFLYPSYDARPGTSCQSRDYLT